MDAVSSMIIKSHGRRNWVLHTTGGEKNQDAIALITEFNYVIHKEYPGVFTIAEESTSFPAVTHSDGIKNNLVILIISCYILNNI